MGGSRLVEIGLRRAHGRPDTSQMFVNVVDQDPLDRLRGRHGGHAGEHGPASIELGDAEPLDDTGGLSAARLQEREGQSWPCCWAVCSGETTYFVTRRVNAGLGLGRRAGWCRDGG